RPLWSALPDGVLKRQLLGELAELAQLDARDLLDLWQRANAREVQRSPGATPHPARHTPQGSGDLHPMPNDHAPRQARRSKSVPPPWPGTSRMPRGLPSARIDHAARLLLSHMDFMEHLGHEDHAVLCAQSAPHGPLFMWIEDLFHTTGPLPWAVLRERLRDHPCEDLALRVMTGAHAQTEGDLKELRLELRDLLNRMLVEDIKAEQSALIERAAHDPSALERYRALEQKRNALMGHPARKA
ncbi:MAG TPA: DNA primase, partial [Giesbergeria sp.]|nr:DNA primase [Giesbergeria sp.]